MYLVTRQTRANQVAAAWENSYGSGVYGVDKIDKLDQLKGLGETPDPDEVDKIIGNNSWTKVSCHECGNEVSEVVTLGEPEDYEAFTADICRKCLCAGLKLVVDEVYNRCE